MTAQVLTDADISARIHRVTGKIAAASNWRQKEAIATEQNEKLANAQREIALLRAFRNRMRADTATPRNRRQPRRLRSPTRHTGVVMTTDCPTRTRSTGSTHAGSRA